MLKEKSINTLSIILNCLEENKASDIVEIDLNGKMDEADFMIIATGSSKTHIKAISDKVLLALKNKKIPSKVEGNDSAEWVLIDSGDVLLNIFKQEVRVFYDLERLWC